MSLSRKTLFLLVALIPCCALVSAWRRVEKAPLDFEVSPHTLGNLEEGERFEKTVTFANKSDSEIRVLGIETSCTCAAVNPSRFVVGPGESVQLTCDFRPQSLNSAEGSKKQVKYLFSAYCDSGTNPRSWVLEGTIRSLIRLQSKQIQFEGATVARNPRRVRLTVGAQVHSVALDFDESVLLASSKNRGGRNYELEVLPTVGLGPKLIGEKNVAEIRVIGLDQSGTEISVKSLLVEWEWKSPYSFSRRYLSFPNTKVGEVQKQTVSIIASDGSDFRVKGHATSSDWIEVEDCSVVNGTTTMTIATRAPNLGTNGGIVNAFLVARNQEISIRLPIMVRGIEGD